jgi:hypothetical protein
VNPYYFPLAYRGFGFNAHRASDGSEAAANASNTVRVDRFDASRLQQRDQREALHLLTGGDLGDATLAFRYISIAGTIVASTGSKLSDRIAELEAAFNVEEAQLESPTTEGVSALTFTDTTEVNNGRGTAWVDPVTGIADGFYVPEQFLCRPAGVPIITQRRSGGDTALYAVELVCPDPRRYCQTAESVVLNSGNGYSAAAPNWNTLQGISVPPVITIVMSGNGNAALTIDLTGDAAGAIVLNMAAAGSGTFTIDCATGVIKKGTAHRADLRASAVSTLFAKVKRNGATASATNTTNVTSVTFAYSQARM